MTPQTLRIPRGLWTDLEETVIQQDRQFLTEVARSLGLSVPEVLRKCLGTGAPQTVQVLTADCDQCPWWSREGNLWRPCPRQRLTPTSACQMHGTTTETQQLGSSPLLASIPTATPVQYNGEIYWLHESEQIVFNEAGLQEPTLAFKFIDHRGQRICVRGLKGNHLLSQ
jgi:hypothetical protein